MGRICIKCQETFFFFYFYFFSIFLFLFLFSGWEVILVPVLGRLGSDGPSTCLLSFPLHLNLFPTFVFSISLCSGFEKCPSSLSQWMSLYAGPSHDLGSPPELTLQPRWQSGVWGPTWSPSTALPRLLARFWIHCLMSHNLSFCLWKWNCNSSCHLVSSGKAGYVLLSPLIFLPPYSFLLSWFCFFSNKLPQFFSELKQNTPTNLIASSP